MAKKEKNSTANTVIKIIIFIILIIAAVLSVILYKKRTRFLSNTNPAANGNTAGNLQNDRQLSANLMERFISAILLTREDSTAWILMEIMSLN